MQNDVQEKAAEKTSLALFLPGMPYLVFFSKFLTGCRDVPALTEFTRKKPKKPSRTVTGGKTEPLSDSEFLRTLLIAAGISPVCFLGGILVGTPTASNQPSLEAIAEVC